MRKLFSDKVGSTIPIRTSGRKKKSGVIVWALIIIGVVFLGLFSVGFYNKHVSPWLQKKGITSSLDDGSGKGTDSLSGSETPVYTDRPNAASFTFQVLDNANSNDVISTGIAVGALSKTTTTNDDGSSSVAYKEWLNPSSANTSQTITTIPEDTILSFYGGSSSYYLYPLTNRQLSVGDVVTLNGATIQTEANMAVVVYDDTKSNELSTADITAVHDYKLSLGEGQKETVYLKISNNGADGRFDLKAICTGAAGTNVSYFDIEGNDWTEVGVPTFVENAQVTVNLTEASATTSEDYDKCFVYHIDTNDVLRLDEWDDAPVIKGVIAAKTDKNPGNDVVWFTAFDGAWARGSDGQGHFDFYQHDSDEGNVGLTETATSPLGKQLGAVIELD